MKHNYEGYSIDTQLPLQHPPISISGYAPLHSQPGICCRNSYGFGICILLLTMAHPQPTKTPTIGWTSPQPPSAQTPPIIPSLPPSTLPAHTHHAIAATIPKLVGIGVPSKYLDFPVASLGTLATVTLKRAKRVRPQRTKKERSRVSIGLRRPRAKAHTAGETPKETWWKEVSHNVSRLMRVECSLPVFVGSRHHSDLCPWQLPACFRSCKRTMSILQWKQRCTNDRSTYQIRQRVQLLPH